MASRLKSYIPVLIIVGLIVAAAAYQEPLQAFFSLRLWDKAAPSKVVAEFLTAVKAGDKAKADSFLGDPSFKPLEKDGQWEGYYIVSNAGTLDFKRSELVSDPIAPSPPEFFTVGPGYSLVSANDAAGKPVAYRLDMKDGSWKITEIRGGTPRAGGGMRPPGGETPKAPAPPKGAKPTPPKGG